MPDIPSIDNGAANTVDGIINFAIYDVAVNAFKTIAVAEMPFLGFPVVSTIFNFVVNTIAQKLYAYLSRIATFTVINIQTDAEKKAYSNAEGALRRAHLQGDQNAIDAATADFKKALGNLIHFDGSAH